MAHPLPQLDGELMLDVFTYSLTPTRLNDQAPHGNGERLAQLGQSVLDTIVTFILFEERPMLSADELKVKHAFLLSDQSMVAWVNYYDNELKKRVRGVPQDVLDDPASQEARFLFNSYVGAVCVQYGLQGAVDWISKLVTPDAEQPLTLMYMGNHPTIAPQTHVQATSPPHAAAPAAPPPYYPNTPQVPPPASPMGVLALFNQTCSQQLLPLDWVISSSGPQHDPKWEVKCMVNGVERGSGRGRNQKQAKELAANEAYQYMQSVNWMSAGTNRLNVIPAWITKGPCS